MKKLNSLLTLIVLITFGCASIVSKTARQITINSSPDQAEFIVKDETGKIIHRGNTPATVTLKTGGGYFKGKEYTVIIRKEGYEEQSVSIRKELNGWYLGNIIFGGLIGLLIVDPLTGAMWTLNPQDINVNLKGKKSGRVDDSFRLSVVQFNDVPPALLIKMVRVK